MSIFNELGLERDVATHLEAYILVQEALEKIRGDLYKSSRLKRVYSYISLLRQISLTMLDDGGPAFGRRLIEESFADMIKEECGRGVRLIGSFLTERQLQHLLKDPKPEGLGWPVYYTDDNKSAV